MKNFWKNFWKNLFIFIEGGLIYEFIEVCYKGAHGHHDRISWTMAVLGGLCFLINGLTNKWFTYEMPLWLQSIIGSIEVLFFEFISGLILNVWLGLNVWDYSDLSGNIMGQICPQFGLYWLFLALICVFLDDLIRWKFFGEEKPHYHVFKFGKKDENHDKYVSL